MSGMAGSLKFTDAQYQAAAADYLANGSAPSWWAGQLQAYQVALGSSTSPGSAPPPPTTQTVQNQRGNSIANAAMQNWLAGLRSPSPTSPAQGGWTTARNSLGQTVYVNNANGQTSFTAPPQSSTPTVADVSKYLQGLIATGIGSLSGSAQTDAATAATIAAGSAGASWLAGLRGLNALNLGSGSMSGSGSVRGSTPSSGSRPGPVTAPNPGSGRSITYFGGDNSINTPTNIDNARNIPRSGGSDSITYDAPISQDPKPMGPITTLLDLTNRDLQENDIFPIRSEITWFTRDQERRILSFTPVVQETALRGPAAFGQRFSFDLGSIQIGDLLLGTALQIRLDHWLDPQTQNVYSAGKLNYADRAQAWEYANSLGTAIIQLAELEIDGKTVETIDGDFIHTYCTLFSEYNAQFGIAYDHLGQTPMKRLINTQRPPSLFPVENGNLNCLLPFFFMRSRLNEALPMIAIREGFVKIHITLRPFDQCVRQMRGYRDTCTSVPSPTPTSFTFNSCTWTYTPSVNSGAWDIPPPFSFTIDLSGETYNWSYSSFTKLGGWYGTPPVSFSVKSQYEWIASTSTWAPSPPPFNIAYEDPANVGRFYYWDDVPQAWRSGGPNAGPPPFNITYGGNTWTSKVGDWSIAAPVFKSVQLLTYGAIVDGSYRSKMLREPFEILHRQLQTFSFDEPLKYSVGSRQDSVRIQLPLEANHPIEEIIWFIRRKGTSTNNEWTNYSGVLESEWLTSPKLPMLQNAIIQANGSVVCDADEQFYREGIASAHRGGYAAYSRFVYGYSFAKTPGQHQPSGSINASRLNALRLVLDVAPPGGVNDALWEVKVFCIGMNWMRFENGLANPMFED